MWKRFVWLVSVGVLVLVLAACGGEGEEGVANGGTSLNEGYKDAVPVETQLALGSLRLEETDLAIDEGLAAELIPLWQAYQTLSTSDKAAEAEIEALINQIQGAMSPDQVEAIAAMELTAEDLDSFLEEFGDQFRPGAFDPDAEGGAGGGRTGGGGFFMPPGGGQPGGGFPGGGFGGGMGMSEDDRATRMAEMGVDPEEMMATFRDRMLFNSLVRTLQAKTGEVDPGESARPRNPMSVVSETTGIPLETLQEEMAGGATLAEAITAHGGDLEVVKAALIEAYSEMPSAEGEDLEQWVEDMLR